MATASQIGSQAVRVGHGDWRPGRGSSDKEAPALMGLRPEIRARSCRWMTLSYSTRWGVALLGLEWGQGSTMGPGLELEQRQKLTQALRWGYWIGRLLSRSTAEVLQTRVLPQPLHLTLSDLCHHLIYYQGGETERERVRMRARERQTEKGSTMPPILLSHWSLAP